MDFQAQCANETRTILTRLFVRYSRAPEKRQETRLPMSLADDLERRRGRLVFCEFGQTWNSRDGWQP
jgi:hypothetical protein